jgi:UDP-2,4-diacetamido-2,4,6-trideoxy-beta-L-altropyranose hydrolase
LLALGSTPAGDRVDGLAHSHWLASSQTADAQDSIRALSGHSLNWVVVDHYALDARWESALRQCGARIFVIDDIADRDHDCDVLLDQNMVASMSRRYADRVPRACIQLLGPGYALLRKEFSSLHEAAHPRNGPVRQLMILMGGADASNETEKAIRAVARIEQVALIVDVVVGAEHPAIERIMAACERHAYRSHVQASNVAELMAGADLAIGGCGGTSWERCCLGVPAVCVSLASNQEAIAEGLAASGAILNLGMAAKVGEAALSQAVLDLVHDHARRAAMSKASLALVDGKGAHRVRDVMTGPL